MQPLPQHSLSSLLQKWQRDAQTLSGYGDERAAQIIQRLAGEVLESMQTADEPTYKLADAAKLTNYTADYLSKSVRRGSIPNHGRKGAPRVKLSECPSRNDTASHLQSITTPMHLALSSKELARAVVANS